MPIENLEEEGLPKNPNLQLAQWKFLLTTEKYKDDKEIKQKLLDFVKENGLFERLFLMSVFLLCHFLISVLSIFSYCAIKVGNKQNSFGVGFTVRN